MARHSKTYTDLADFIQDRMLMQQICQPVMLMGILHGNGAASVADNIGSKGDRIYHLPGGRWYDRTIITMAKGERWFCSEEEARDAGWRRRGTVRLVEEGLPYRHGKRSPNSTNSCRGVTLICYRRCCSCKAYQWQRLLRAQ